jgi:hypothetical protein
MVHQRVVSAARALRPVRLTVENLASRLFWVFPQPPFIPPYCSSLTSAGESVP